jgi:hypothetical protein
MKQHFEQYRQQILAEVSDQMHAVDSRISAVDSRISSVEEATSRLESQSQEDGVRRDAQFQELSSRQAQAQAGIEALLISMAALTHSKQKDS